MKKSHITKISRVSTIGLAVLAMTGCMGTKHLSEGITEAGHVQAEDIVFPELDDAWQLDGQFPNSENLSKIRPGIGKDELYQLIGRPHFSEAQHAREWDYIMKFYQADNSVKICQYKVIFDEHFKGQEFYWSPSDCPPRKTTIKSVAPMITAPTTQRITLAADALFMFDKWQPQAILPQGRYKLNELSSKLKSYQHSDDTRILITGHTDHYGEDIYNMNLSQLRAQTVRNYLVSQGIDARSIIATGAGETQPIKNCSPSLSRAESIRCLQPNRRVTIDVTMTK